MNPSDNYDLAACLEYNPHVRLDIKDVVSVLALIEGANDECDWHWLLEIKTPPFRFSTYAYLAGGCDYTGWDCQSWARIIFFYGLYELEDVVPEGIIESFRRQVREGCDLTWDEQIRKDVKEGKLDGLKPR